MMESDGWVPAPTEVAIGGGTPNICVYFVSDGEGL